MPRLKRPSDEAYNARRRAARAAAKAKGELIASDQAYVNRRRLERQARRIEREAQNDAGVFGSRLSKLGDILREKRARTYARKGRYSQTALDDSPIDIMDAGTQADIIMDSNIGSRIWAGTQEIWQDASYGNREQAILDAFGADSMAEVLEKIEKRIGDKLYAEDSNERYDEIATAIMKMVAKAA